MSFMQLCISAWDINTAIARDLARELTWVARQPAKQLKARGNGKQIPRLVAELSQGVGWPAGRGGPISKLAERNEYYASIGL